MLNRLRSLPVAEMLYLSGAFIFFIQIIGRGIIYLNTINAGVEIVPLIFTLASELAAVIWQPMILLGLAKILDSKKVK